MKEKFTRNETLKSTFDLVAKDFESIGPHYFTYFGKQLVDKSAIVKGKKVLDVACGRGASLFRSAEVVGQEGCVVGVDFSQEMIKFLKKEACDKGYSNIIAMQMDAENLTFNAGDFDYVFCGLSTHFFSQPLLAVDEMHKVLKVGGKVAISSWSIKKEKNKTSAYERAYSKVYGKKATTKEKAPARPDFSSHDGFKNILESADFHDVIIEEEIKDFYYKSKEEWWSEQSNNATRGFFERLKSLDEDLFNRFKTLAFKEIEESMENGCIPFKAKVLYGYGIK